MRITQIWRYPVKSMQGERLEAANVDGRGLVGDRRAALFDLGTGKGLTARREPRLLLATGRWNGDGSVSIVLPDGRETDEDAVLSAWLGRDVALRTPDQVERAPVYENPTDVADEAGEPWIEWRGPRGRFHDSTRTQVSLCTEGSIAEFAPLDEVRRFRFNVLVDGTDEDALVGTTIALGDVGLEVTKQIDRCVMVTRPQPGGIERDVDVLKRINADRAGCLGVGTLVRRPGRIAVGDELVAA